MTLKMEVECEVLKPQMLCSEVHEFWSFLGILNNFALCG